MRVLAALLLLLAAAELGLRAVDIARGEVGDPALSDPETFGYGAPDHPFLQYTAGKNLRWFGKDPSGNLYLRLATNSEGFRTRELYPKLPGVVRVVLVGDSFTFGLGLDQADTIAFQLEKLCRERLSPRVEVLALGVPSYSGLRYAMLGKLYFSLLKPDAVVASVDASDLEEDVKRIKDYVLDSRGEPVVLKKAEELSHDDPTRLGPLVMDEERRALRLPELTLQRRLAAGSSLFRRVYPWWRRLAGLPLSLRLARPVQAAAAPKIVRPADPQDLRDLPANVRQDTVPWPLPRAYERYRPTLTALRSLKRSTTVAGGRLWIAAYPYPWFVSTEEAVDYQRAILGAIYDLRGNRTHPRVLARYAAELGVPMLDAYPAFAADPKGKYISSDPHFTPAGARLYAELLFDALRGPLRERLSSAAQATR